jgi:hypothetical protein
MCAPQRETAKGRKYVIVCGRQAAKYTNVAVARPQDLEYLRRLAIIKRGVGSQVQLSLQINIHLLPQKKIPTSRGFRPCGVLVTKVQGLFFLMS